MKLNIGIADRERQEIADGLGRLLADTYTLYLKTHNYHWNVTGPMFQTLHLMFETQYTELAEAVDVLAERMRALGHYAPGSYAEFSKLSTVEDAQRGISAREMIVDLVESNETVIRTARELVEMVEEANDQSTLDVLTTRMETHEKTAWMLRSLLEEPMREPTKSTKSSREVRAQ